MVAEEIARTSTTTFGAGLDLRDEIIVPYVADLCDGMASRMPEGDSLTTT
ncbi:hypothetical protein ACU5JM_00905 (plasmid) [Rhodococcus erythropolis]